MMTPVYIYLSPTQRHIQTHIHVTENKKNTGLALTPLNPKTEVEAKKGRYLD
jgi:hypothetical protein